MCHSAVPFVGRKTLVVHRGWLVLQTPVPGNASTTVTREARGDPVGGGNSGQGGSIRRCVCSPSQHPGSFRCRRHHAEYVWRGKTIK